MTDTPPKSALDLVMERLRQKDAATGAGETTLTDAQRAAIAEARQIAEARIAERKILHQSALAGEFDPEKRLALEDEHRRDVERITGDRDRKIDAIRRGNP